MTKGETSRELIRFLLNAGSYPEKAGQIDHIETHISHVFLGDSHVYKIKKPVNFGFLDFSSLGKRRRFCEKEVLLNARLARDIYLGVVPIYRSGGEYSFKKKNKSRLVEYAVKMKKIPMDCLLFNLISQGRPLYLDMDNVGRTLAAFHENLKPYRGKKFGGVEAIAAATDDNFTQILPFREFVGRETYQTLVSYTREFLEKNRGLLAGRKRHGFIREGHGDLHCQHICLRRPPIIFDCIEFNEYFRIIDVLEDIAFLFMDLEYRGRFDLTARLFKSYFAVHPGALNDELLKFYKVCRAIVRGKVEGLTARTVAGPDEREAAGVKARNYFSLADYYVRYAQQPFNPVVFMGLSGSGKSTIAKNFSSNGVLLGSDELRKETAGIKKGKHHYNAFGEGIYTPELTRRIYSALLKKAATYATAGKRVIVDATYLKADQRKNFYDSCIGRELNPFFVHCFAAEEILKNRIRARMKKGTDISDASVQVLEHQLKHLEEPDELPGFRILRINTQDAIGNIVSALKEFL